MLPYKKESPLQPGDYQLLFQNTPGSYLVLAPDTQFTIVDANVSYLKDTSTTLQEIVGRGVFEVFTDNPANDAAEGAKNLRASLLRALETKAADIMPVQRYDLRRGEDGDYEERYWSPINVPVLSPAGEVRFIIHRVQDVTEYVRLVRSSESQARHSAAMHAENRKMEAEILQHTRELAVANEELRRANQALKQLTLQARTEAQLKDEFLAMLAHELRNPLAGIASALELLELAGHDAVKAAEFRAVCFRQLDNLGRMVDDLLDVSRVSRGVVHLEQEALDLRDTVEAALHAVRGQFDQRRHKLSTNIAAGKYRLRGDATRLEQVVTNLLSNACKYTEDGGQIMVSLTTERKDETSWAVLQIQDNGRGIPPDKLATIFGLFVQIETAIDRSNQGLGIGLTLAQKLVEMHGGSITAESEGAGQGSLFTVRLPIEESLLIEPQPRKLAGYKANTPALRILVIEDNRDARDMLKCLLEVLGHQVDVASTGTQGLERIEKSRPEVAFVDIGLPELDGYEVARRIRAGRMGNGIRLIALTGYGGVDNERAALAAGFDAYVVKPLDLATLTGLLPGIRHENCMK